jgi:molybdate transport system substrate-binding protein
LISEEPGFKESDMKHWKQFIVVIALGCMAGTAAAADIIVSAAASLTNAFTDMGKEFEKANQGHKVLFNFAGSGALLQQISRGAPVDVFASADQDTMDKAQQQNLIVRSSRADFTRNTLVVVVPGSGGASVTDLAGLKDEQIKRIALSNPETVPVGKYSKEALEAAGLWDALKAKMINTQNVRQSLDYVARGEVDAGFVYATDAAIMPGRVKVVFDVPTKTPITYPIAVVKGNGKENLALKFVEFVKTESAQAILAKYGFLKP